MLRSDSCITGQTSIRMAVGLVLDDTVPRGSDMAAQIFTSIHHIALVGRDADKTASCRKAPGLGRGRLSDDASHADHRDRGRNIDLRCKVLNLGRIHVQVCQPDKGDGPQKSFLNGEGVFQPVPDSDRTDGRAAPPGLALLMTGGGADGRDFSFYYTQEMAAGVVLAQRSS